MERAMLGAAFWVAVFVFVMVVPETASAIPANLRLPIVVGAIVIGFGFAMTESREFKRVARRARGEATLSDPNDTCPACGTLNYFPKYNPAWPKQCYKCGKQW